MGTGNWDVNKKVGIVNLIFFFYTAFKDFTKERLFFLCSTV